MGRTNKRIERKSIRVQVDAVTHEKEVTELTAVQLAYERVIQVIDSKMLGLSPAECERLAERILERVSRMLPHCERDAA